MTPEQRNRDMQTKSHPDYSINQPVDRFDEKLMQSAALFLLKISKAAETFIPSETQY